MNEVLYHKNIMTESMLNSVWNEISLFEASMGSPEQSGADTNKKQGLGILMNSSQAELCVPTISRLHSLVEHSGEWSVLINKYRTDDYYLSHTDDSEITMTIPLSKDTVSGGEFYFEEMDKVIPMENNSLIAFPGKFTHGVKPITGNVDRYSLTFFYYKEDNQ